MRRESCLPDLYPVFLDLARKKVLLVGGGEVAFRKARSLLGSGCLLTVAASSTSPAFRDWLARNSLEWSERPYRDGEAAAYFLVISATDDPEVNRRIHEDASRAQRLVNVVDQPRLCNLHVPSVLKRDRLQIAVSTAGACPALARRLRLELEERVSKRYGPLLERLAVLREHYRRILPTPAARKKAIEEVVASEAVRRFLDGEADLLDEMLRRLGEGNSGDPGPANPG